VPNLQNVRGAPGVTMTDPHVVSLEYALELDETLRFDNPAPVEGDAGSFTYSLANGVLTLSMKFHYATAQEAKNAAWPFLCAWELDYALKRGRREFRFRFVRPHIIDRPGGSHVIQADTVTMTLKDNDATLIATLRTYPAPPVGFDAFPDVDTLWNHYENQRLGREHLPSMGYFFLTVIETLYGAPSAPQRHASHPRNESRQPRRCTLSLRC
jgi:hypothetical protein